MKKRFFATLALALSLVTLASGCGKSHYCTSEAPRLEVAVGQSIRLGQASPYLIELAGQINKDELSTVARHFHDMRFGTLRHYLSNITEQGTQDLVDMRTLGNELMAQYCEVALPVDRCIAGINRLMFGNYPATVEACQSIQTASAAACVEAVTGARSMDITPEEIRACSGFYYPNQAACVASVATLTFALREGTIAACEHIYTNAALSCLRATVAGSVMDIEEATIRACGAPTMARARLPR